MGQSTSKPTGDKLFTQATVDKDLRTAIEQVSETDTVRQFVTDKYIEDKVAERLYEERVSVEKLLNESAKQVQPLSDDRVGIENGIDSRDLRKQVAKLHAELTSRPLRGELDGKGKKVRNELVECLIKNKEKPLKCREVFAEFQKEISRVEKATRTNEVSA